MSYSRRFTRTITVHYSGSVSYPASQSGGSTSYSGSKTETIVFDVEVDTDPFDHSINAMKGEVDGLTTSIVATEAAQVASIRENSRKVASTIVAGFFKTVRSDISQKIAELKIKTDTLLIQLHELAKRCNDKKRVMNVDYQRISSRYAKIFDELNHELENRIYSVDEPVFKFVDKTGDISGDVAKQVSVPAIHAGENARAHAKISAALAKRQAVNTIGKAHRFLDVQYRTDRILSRCLQEGGEQATFSAPYCIIEARDNNGDSTKQVFCAPMLESIDKNHLLDSVPRSEDNASLKIQNKQVHDYFNAEVANIISNDSSEHAKRVAQLTNQLFQRDCK